MSPISGGSEHIAIPAGRPHRNIAGNGHPGKGRRVLPVLDLLHRSYGQAPVVAVARDHGAHRLDRRLAAEKLVNGCPQRRSMLGSGAGSLREFAFHLLCKKLLVGPSSAMYVSSLLASCSGFR